jgi:Fe-S-cluster containining protein
MRDGAIRTAVKRVARAWFELELAVARWARTRRQSARYVLAGACRGCAKCCEEPSIRVGRLVWYFPLTQRLFLLWQRRVNGFVLARKQRDARVLVFECTHFDRQTRRCDSYHSRPGICRDYPRALFDQPWPELFDECGYRPLDTQGEGLQRALDAAQLPIETRQLLKKKLHLRE